MTPTPEQPKRRGRPPVPESERMTERAEMRMTLAERQKFDALGGADWVRRQLQRAKLPA